MTVFVDGRYSQDIVLFAGEQRFTYDVALGPLARARHRVKVAFNRAKSPPGARRAKVWHLRPSLAARDDVAARYAPILYGRDLPEIPGRYVFAEVDKDTSYPAPPASGTWVGTALAVKLRGGDRWYTSHHDVPDWSIQRDDPAATTVELPPGSTSADVEAIKAIAVPVAKTSDPPAPAPSDYTIHVRRLNRGFMLDDAFLPQPSFLQWEGDAVLTPEQPEAVIWEAP